MVLYEHWIRKAYKLLTWPSESSEVKNDDVIKTLMISVTVSNQYTSFLLVFNCSLTVYLSCTVSETLPLVCEVTAYVTTIDFEK